MTSLTIRAYCETDSEQLSVLIHDSVRLGAAGRYTYRQLEAWSPSPRPPAELHARLAPQTVWIAEDSQGLAGMMSLESDGNIDMAFVHPRVQGQGVGALLLDTLTGHARSAGLATLRTDASHLFRDFLEQRGWALVASQQVERYGVKLTNHRMSFDLRAN